jgi:hypothetical protein
VSKRGDLTGPCGEQLACSSSHGGDVSTYNTERDVSSVGFIAGGVLAAAGVTLIVLSPAGGGPSTSAFVGPAGAGIRGAF